MEHVVQEINDLFVFNDNADILLEKFNQLINKVELNIQMEMHSLLSLEALKFFYENRARLQISDEVKEHLVWWYFKCKFNEFILDSEFQDLLLVYKETQYISLESIVISLLKANILSVNQVVDADSVFSSKAYKRERYAHSCQIDIMKGNKLDLSKVNALLNFRLYPLLESAISKDCISKEGIQLLSMPYLEAADKKIRLKLANLAQKYL
ncbi:hypothetical protein [Paenibacillus baekrokdamisoli]|uniref:hypothetical protein n=1 Tax=Paenibacillus baekrokdamisoli TaxID=1712516 RepID=UPI001C8475A5|nr:hypothetical protein [Paenibacillus baekrokdamisoli]